MVASGSLTALEVNGPLDALHPGAASLGWIAGRELGGLESVLRHIRSPTERGTGRAPPDSSRRREPPDREEDPSAVTTGRWKEGHDIIDSTLFEELTSWHERFLIDAENWDRLL